MKNEQSSELNVMNVGSLTSVKATISADKMVKLFDLLQSPYSNPIGSIVRETATNSWDAHMEIGNNSPIIITLDIDTGVGHFISFKDEGIGMSPDRINKVYVNYLESTKENTNNESGYFGIGSKSPLSYANEYYVTTIYDKICYEYLISKDDDGIPVITTLDMFVTDQPNGTLVKMYIEHTDLDAFLVEIKEQLRYFEQLYVVNTLSTYSSNFINEFKIVKGEHFICRVEMKPGDRLFNMNREPDDLHCVIGQVKYPLDRTKIITHYTKNHTNEELDTFTKKIEFLQFLSIGIQVPIGHDCVKVTTTRETIKYLSNTIPYLIEKIEKTYDEVVAKNTHWQNTEIDISAGLSNPASIKDIASIFIYKERYKLSFGDFMESVSVSGLIDYSELNHKTSYSYNGEKNVQVNSLIQSVVRNLEAKVYDSDGITFNREDAIQYMISTFYNNVEVLNSGIGGIRITYGTKQFKRITNAGIRQYCVSKSITTALLVIDTSATYEDDLLTHAVLRILRNSTIDLDTATMTIQINAIRRVLPDSNCRYNWLFEPLIEESIEGTPSVRNNVNQSLPWNTSTYGKQKVGLAELKKLLPRNMVYVYRKSIHNWKYTESVNNFLGLHYCVISIQVDDKNYKKAMSYGIPSIDDYKTGRVLFKQAAKHFLFNSLENISTYSIKPSRYKVQYEYTYRISYAMFKKKDDWVRQLYPIYKAAFPKYAYLVDQFLNLHAMYILDRNMESTLGEYNDYLNLKFKELPKIYSYKVYKSALGEVKNKINSLTNKNYDSKIRH